MGEGCFLAGLAENACVRAQVVTVTSENSLYPKENLQSGFPWEEFRFNAAGTNLEIKFDTNLLTQGETDFEADTIGAVPGGRWVTVAGTPTVEAAPAAGHGANSLRFNATAESNQIDLSLTVGRDYGINFSLYSNSSENIDVFVLNLETGKWWAGGVWNASKTVFQTHTAASWSDYTLNILAETRAWGYVGGYARHRFIIEKRTGTGAAYIDDISIFPYCSIASLHNYRDIPDGLSVLAQSSADNSAWTTRGTLPSGRRYRNYITFSVQAQRWWKFLISGITYFAPTIGQPVLGQRHTFITKPSWGMVTAREMPKGGREDLPISLAAAPRYRFEMEWESQYSSYQQIADEMLGASNFGDEPIVVVPDIVDAEIVYGRGASMASISARLDPIDTMLYQLTIQDDAYPVVVT